MGLTSLPHYSIPLLYLTDKIIDIINGGKKEDMKTNREWIKIMVLVPVILSMVIGGVAATACVEVTTSMEVIGNGTYDAEVLMQSSDDDSGLKYYGEAYTPALGMFGPSTVIVSTAYMMTQNNQSELMISEESEITNIRSKRCFKNYDLGTLQAFNTFGNYSILAEFGGDVNMSEMMVEAQINGKVLSEVKVRALNASHFYIVWDKAEYRGEYNIEMSNLIERVEAPRADYDDWLGCP